MNRQEVLKIDTYYRKAIRFIELGDTEEAITAFISGVDHGFVKCAYGLLDTVIRYGSFTVTEDEAISVFESNYPSLRLVAEEGDAEAMVMVAEGIRLGFVDDEDEPYLYWLKRAESLGEPKAYEILDELDESDDPFALPVADPEMGEPTDDSDLLLLDDPTDGWDDLSDVPEDVAPLAEPDWMVNEELGIDYLLKRRAYLEELMKARDTYSYEDEKNKDDNGQGAP